MRPALIGLGLLLGGGCAGRGAGPPGTVIDYAAAVERGDYQTAYKLMSSSYRQRVSAAEFRRLLEQDAPAMAADVRALRGGADRWASRVEMSLPGDDRVGLVREAGAWRLDDRPLDPFGQGTPRAALRTFIRAAETRRYDVLLRLAPARFRPSLSEAKLRVFWEGEQSVGNRTLLRELRLNIGNPIAEEGDEAFMTYGSSRQVRFLREDGLWRIDSPE